MNKAGKTTIGGTGRAPTLDREEWKGTGDKNAGLEITLEVDIPSDGADSEGEAEIKQLPPQPELSVSPENARK